MTRTTLALLMLATPAAATINRPFASHPVTYAAGAIRPSHVTQATLDQAVRDFYDAWKVSFLRQTCGAGRYVVVTKTRPGNLTVSEGHGYGMILAALMAGHDPDAQAIFDGMFAHFRAHPTDFHDRLMSYFQNTACRDPGDAQDSATDGDLDIAYALLLADKQWGSCGRIDYLAEALAVIADLKDGDVDPTGRYTLLGDWVAFSTAQYQASTRSSDFMPDHYRSFANATGDVVWTGLLDATYQLVDDMQTAHSPATGLLPDFITDPMGTPEPAPPGFLEGPNDGAYSYNACRDPWRLATDYLLSNEARAKTAVQRINTWVRTATGNDPAGIQSGYMLDGTPIAGTDYLSMAFVAPLGVGATVDASNQAWLNALWDLMLATPVTAEGYYENTLKLLAMTVMSGNWWAPELVGAPTCTPTGTALCTNPGDVVGARLDIGRPGGALGDESLKLAGTLFFPQGTPAPAPFTAGAQLLVEDLGAGNAALYDLTTATDPVPSAADGACDPRRDGWRVTTSRTTYRNGSTALDPPVCTPGSARGLSRLQYRARSGFDLEVGARARRTTIPAVVGPVRATVVLGSTVGTGAAGQCGVSAPLACASRGSSLRCE